MTEPLNSWLASSFIQSGAIAALQDAQRLNARAFGLSNSIDDFVQRLHEEEEARLKAMQRVGLQASASAQFVSQINASMNASLQFKLQEEERRRHIYQAMGNITDNYAGHVGEFAGHVKAFELQHDGFTKSISGGVANFTEHFNDQHRQISAFDDIILRRHDDLRIQLFGHAAYEHARGLAEAAQLCHLGDHLDSFRTSVGALTDKMLYLGSLDAIASPETLKAFVQASTVSDILNSQLGYGTHSQQAVEFFARQSVPNFSSIQDYGHMLSAAGLSLPHWPHRRLLTIGERQRRLSRRIKATEQSRHAKTAWTVFNRYEQVLREIIDEVMTSKYGDEWPQERLPRCGCSTLLGRWHNRGGALFDHADFAQYIAIMCDEEHFEAVFSLGFGDRDALKDLLTKVKKLRAAVMHFHEFTKEDLRDVRTTWKAIEAGLLGLTSEYEFAYH